MNKPSAPQQKEKTFSGDRLLVFRNVHTSEPKATNLFATVKVGTVYGDRLNFDGKEAQLYDWKADFEKGEIYIHGAVYMGYGQYQSFDGTFPCELVTEDLKKPGRNFEWNKYGAGWRNVKTGEKRIAA